MPDVTLMIRAEAGTFQEGQQLPGHQKGGKAVHGQVTFNPIPAEYFFRIPNTCIVDQDVQGLYWIS